MGILVGASKPDEIETKSSELGEAIKEKKTIDTPKDDSNAGIAECVNITKKTAKARRLS